MRLAQYKLLPLKGMMIETTRAVVWHLDLLMKQGMMCSLLFLHYALSLHICGV